MKYCYIRVSTEKQDYVRQENILKEKGYINGVNCEYITETYTGTTSKRPELLKLIDKLQADDTLIACELSRISRSVKDFNNLIDEILKKKKANIIILKENFNLLANGNMDAMTKLILNITSSFAEFERDIISDRTRETLVAKRKQGIKFGRPRQQYATTENLIKTLELMITEKIGQKKAALKTHYPTDTLQRDLKKYYEKYKTKNYDELLEYIKKEI